MGGNGLGGPSPGAWGDGGGGGGGQPSGQLGRPEATHACRYCCDPQYMVPAYYFKTLRGPSDLGQGDA